MSTYAELKAQAEALLKQANEILSTEREQAIAEINQRLADLGLTPDDLVSDKKRGTDTQKPKRIVPVKYRGLNGETWTGRGQKPTWLVEQLNKGRKIEDFLV